MTFSLISLSTISRECVSIVIKHIIFYLNGLSKSPWTILIKFVKFSTISLWYYFIASRLPPYIFKNASSVSDTQNIILINNVIYAGSILIHYSLYIVLLLLNDFSVIVCNYSIILLIQSSKYVSTLPTNLSSVSNATYSLPTHAFIPIADGLSPAPKSLSSN